MKKELKIGIFAIITFAIFAYFVIKTDSLVSLLSKGKSYPLYARFSNVSGLFESAPVRLAGVRIGIVESIYLEHDRAVVKMLIQKKYSLTTDARAGIASVGLVGENFIEISYRKKYLTPNPSIIPEGGEIETLSTFGLEEIGDEIQVMSPKIRKTVDSLNAILADKNFQDSLKGTLANMKDISENLKRLSSGDGTAVKTIETIDAAAHRLTEALDSLKTLMSKLDGSLFKEEGGIVDNLDTTANQLKSAAADLEVIIKRVRQGEGTAGKLLAEDGLYNKLDGSIETVNTFLKDLEKKKAEIDKTKLAYYAGMDYLTDEKRARFGLGMNINFSGFTLFTRVRENTREGGTDFTVMAGKRYKYFSAAAGMVDSGLGAALYLNLFDRRLNLQLEGSRFYKDAERDWDRGPLLKAILSFSLSKNINVSAGYEDLLEKESRKFMVGVSFNN
jgi:phospholipid/cholesterol/gamma-HCH transport system substrate-binding protein